EQVVLELLHEHCAKTGSAKARVILDSWDRCGPLFRKVVPHAAPVPVTEPAEVAPAAVTRRSPGRWRGTQVCLRNACATHLRRRSSGSSRLSRSDCQLASMMFSEQPMVLQRSAPLADSTTTRGLAAVPRCSSTMRTL